MPSRARQNRFDVPRQRGVGAALRRWTIPAIGALTPVGLIVVNIAAFIVQHLAAFRLGISILALVSGIMLNAWTGLKIYGVAKSRFPNFGLLHDHNQEVLLVVGMAVIVAISFVEALFCYNGLGDERALPNASTFYLGVVAIAIPIVLQGVFGRLTGGRSGTDRSKRTDGYPAPPPPPSDGWEPL
ncbi:MAG: hypothetical protein JF887_12885 [Candidatus Dormibacteraeota bacterium]|uniref:Uncharacterized protein n=1 Tax=Candidatus Amunia macphersoniae TaxID=3127014 RepID=A0A934KSG1_9BACT|nr:hypothetical protein [Candidatus Dormibacteraeota bacterium]